MVKTGVEGTTTYDYDATGNLNSVTMPTKTVSYTYDGMNRRIAKAVDGTVTERFIYLSQLKPFAKVNSDGSIAETYIYGTKVNIPEYVIRDGNTYRIITDHLGSLRLVIDSTDGTVKQRMSFDEFGTVTEDYIESGFEPLPFGYAGGLYDRDTKLVTFGVREYDSTTGRWMEKEPLGFRGAMNFYTYAHNNPIHFVDWDGLKLKLAGDNSDQSLIWTSLEKLKINSPTAKKLIELLENTDIEYTISLTEDGNSHNKDTKEINYNYSKQCIKDGSEDWHKRDPEIGLAHELIHALHSLAGTRGDGKNEEYKTIGIEGFENLGFTENKIRDEYNLPLRPEY